MPTNGYRGVAFTAATADVDAADVEVAEVDVPDVLVADVEGADVDTGASPVRVAVQFTSLPVGNSPSPRKVIPSR